MADAVGAWACENRGACGYGDVGAVIGATYPAELAELRRVLPEAFILVPGFGAQGGCARDVAAAFEESGLGAVVNSSRGILFPFAPDEPSWERAIERTTRETIRVLGVETAMGRLLGGRLRQSP